MRTLLVSDIHGGFRALEQVFERAKFDPSKDQLICLGDVCDGWRETVECIRLLKSIPNLVYLMGNHDSWTLDWLQGRWDGIGQFDPGFSCWTSQGGQATINSIEKHKSKQEVLDFLENAEYFYQQNNKLFVHAGIYLNTKVENNDENTLIWDRDLVRFAKANAISVGWEPVVPYDEIFVGHTPTVAYGKTVPQNYCNLWMIDTGASYDGPLTVIDADTKEFWQSDPVVDLYPGEKAR